MKKILLIPVGSSGDVHPFIAIGREMKKRNHAVTMVTNGFFRPMAERAGFDFIELGTRKEYLTTTENPDLWHPRRAFPLLMKQVALSLPPMVKIIRENDIPGQTVVACGSLAFGARIAQEKYGVPTVMIHLQPSIFRSVEDPPILPGFSIPKWFPASGIRALYWLVDRAVDFELGRPLNAFIKTLGMKPVKNVMGDWWHSPQLTVGLFPDWYYPVQKGWPPFIKLTGFPVFDGEGVEEMSAGVEEFLKAGDPPVVFTGGSAMKLDKDFFAESVEACTQLGRRGVLIAQFRDQVPANLPSHVKHFSYVPFSRIFPRAAALVHHGGIGTVSQCFKAGRPQLVVPLAHDQFDNAERVKNFGVGLRLDSNQYHAKNIIPLIHQILSEPSFLQSAAKVAPRVDGAAALRQTCDLIETL